MSSTVGNGAFRTRATLVGLLLLAGFAAPSAQSVAIVDVTVIPMDRETTLAHQTVVARGERILSVGAVENTPVPVSEYTNGVECPTNRASYLSNEQRARTILVTPVTPGGPKSGAASAHSTGMCQVSYLLDSGSPNLLRSGFAADTRGPSACSGLRRPGDRVASKDRLKGA